MKHSAFLTAALLLSLASAPASAQPRDNERVVVSLEVAGFGPQSGKVGDLVTINGKGFTRKVIVLIGGQVVQPTQMGSSSISFKVPARFGDGNIVLRKPGVAQDIPVGVFTVMVDPIIQSFAPAAGAPGTRVEIRGRAFQNGDRVLLAGQSLRIESYSPNRLVVLIPPGARTDHLIIENAQRRQFKSPRPFRVLEPAPVITSFQPTAGPPGSKVRIQGQNLGRDMLASYGRMNMQVVGSGPSFVDALIPPTANRDQPIILRSGRGTVTTATSFQLELLPVLASFSPLSGTVGDRIQLNGRNFREGDRVTLGGQPLRLIELRGGRLTVEIPPNARTGLLAIHRGSTTTQADKPFVVFYAPIISGFAPSEGAAGATVTITGQNFSARTRAFYGTANMRITSWTPTSLVVQIPPRSQQSAVLAVLDQGQRAESAAAFQLLSPPVCGSFSPASGKPGTEVVLLGSNLTAETKVFFGSTPARIVRPETRGGGLVVRVPDNATPGKTELRFEHRGMSSTARRPFFVESWATISGLQPGRAKVGDTIMVNGAGLGGAVRIFFGNLELPITKRHPRGTKLWVTIPEGASGSQPLTVDEAGHRTTSSVALEIEAPPPPVKVRDHRDKDKDNDKGPPPGIKIRDHRKR